MAVKRRKFIRVTSYLVALSLVLAAAGYFAQRAKASYESTLERVRFEGLTSLCEYSRELSGGLRLLAVSAGDSVTDSAAYVCSRAIGAIGCTSCFDNKKIENINRFLNETYSFAEDFSPSDDRRSAAQKLSVYAEEIYYHLSDLSVAVMGGAYTLSEYDSIYLKSDLPYFEDYLDFSNGSENEIFSLTASAESQNQTSCFNNEDKNISADEAKKKASSIINIESILWREKETDSQTGFEVYHLAHGSSAVEICKQGGRLCRLINPQPYSEDIYSFDEALQSAESFAKKHGYNKLKLLSGDKDNFTARFYFVPEVNGVLLLTSPIEISVCLANGVVIYFDASEYILNYRTEIYASDGKPDLTAMLPSNLTLKKSALCLADINGRERLCYLGICSFDGDNIWVYFDYQSLKILKTEL